MFEGAIFKLANRGLASAEEDVAQFGLISEHITAKKINRINKLLFVFCTHKNYKNVKSHIYPRARYFRLKRNVLFFWMFLCLDE